MSYDTEPTLVQTEGLTANKFVDAVEHLLGMYRGFTDDGKMYWRAEMLRYALLVAANRPPGTAFEVVLELIRREANERFRSLQINCPFYFKSILAMRVNAQPNLDERREAMPR